MLCLLLHLAIALTILKFYFVIHCAFLCSISSFFLCCFSFVSFKKFHVHLLILFVACLYIFNLSCNNIHGCSYITTIFTLQLFLHCCYSCLMILFIFNFYYFYMCIYVFVFFSKCLFVRCLQIPLFYEYNHVNIGDVVLFHTFNFFEPKFSYHGCL